MIVSPPFTRHFSELAAQYDVVLCDVWGVVHNGAAATIESCDALIHYRQGGGLVVLITNAPRPGEVVWKFLDRLAVPREVCDAIVSSGDVTRTLIAARAGQKVLVLERRERLGGACTLERPFSDDRYSVSPCAYVVGLLD